MVRRGPRSTRASAAVPPARVTIDDILRAEPAAVALLAASDRAACTLLAKETSRGGACPVALVRALLEVDDLSGLSNRVSAVGGDPDDQMGAWYRFREWFTRGIEEGLPATDPAALRLRYWRALDDVAEGTAERTRALTLDIERAGDSVAHRSLLGRALLLLTRRLVEDGDREGALEAATRAEEVLASVDDPKWHAQAIGTRAGVLIGLGQTAEARALLDSLPASWRPLFEGGRYRGDVFTASLADRLREAEAPEYEEDKLPGPFR